MTNTGTELALVQLTAHPLQRVGAYAVARLADARDPADVDEAGLEHACAAMLDDLLATKDVRDAKAPGGFWLGASHLLWPNSPLAHPSRGKQSPGERADRLRAWRTLSVDPIAAPCALCGRPACGFFGKVDVPLGASVVQRNTTARGHEGLALCRACVLCFWALPYGCAISSGRAAALHSADDGFMRKTVRAQVNRMRLDPIVAHGLIGDKRPYARQVVALRRIQSYGQRIVDGVELIVFSNSNKEQTLDRYAMDQPVAEWTRSQDLGSRGWRYLVRAHSRGKVPGLSGLANTLFTRPSGVVLAVSAYLASWTSELGMPPGEIHELGELCSSYATEVLDVNESALAEIRNLAANIAEAADKGDLQKFVVAHRKGELRGWLRRKAIDRTLTSKVPAPFITDEQWRLLFDSDDRYLHRDLLLIRTLTDVHARNPSWRDDDPETRAKLDDELNDEGDSPEGEDE